MKTRIASLALLILVAGTLAYSGNHNTYPLPEDRGTAGVLSALGKLPVYVRVLETTAHPDDESAGTLTWLTRNAHARTALFSLTRGEGGQNVLGSERYEAMGLLRTGELLEACRFYGVELYFSSAVDFGFSKNAEETLSKWGRESMLGEVVRFIRTWQPTVIISRFQGNSRDGHGHHQAAGILTHEAFRAAGDPQRFPEQIQGGLRPWQAAKLYHSTFSEGGPAANRSETDWTVRVPVGDYDPVLGRSYREIGSEGYSKHRSQGNAPSAALPGQAYEYFKLVDSTTGVKPKEDGFFDAIDTSLTAIAGLAGQAPAPSFLREDLAEAQKYAEESLRAFDVLHPERSAAGARKGAAVLAELVRKVEASPLPVPSKQLIEAAVQEKLGDFHEAVSATLGMYLVARTQNATASPGQRETVTVQFFNRGSAPVDLKRITLETPEGWRSPLPADAPLGKVAARTSAQFKFSIEIPLTAKLTQPYWCKENRNATRYSALPGTRNAFAAFDEPEFSARAVYRFEDTEIPITEPARGQAGDPLRGSDFVDFQVVPALSLSMSPEFGISPVGGQAATRDFQVSIVNNLPEGATGTVKLIAPGGWSVQPEETAFKVTRKGESYATKFHLGIPAQTPTGVFQVEAVATTGGQDFRRGYRVVSYPENWTRNIYSPSSAVLELFDVKIASNLSVGYVTGAGDDVPASLEQLGVKVQFLSAADLGFGDLRRFGAIVTGIRAYNLNEDLKAQNQRLLQYVENGGVLIVQYNTPARAPSSREDGAPFPYAPYPITLSTNDRITVEESPLAILAPQNAIFTGPNKITQGDFQGWVQERGLYFASHWDARYEPLLSGHDPGEEAKNGGMLVAKYGKGYYVYTAYAWFRQLPAGVPGAFRIFANMLSLAAK